MSLFKRLKHAARAFWDYPRHFIQLGVDVKRCDRCEHKNENLYIRDNLLVTAGARAAYMDVEDIIELPTGLKGENILSGFIARMVDQYLREGSDVIFDDYIETELLSEYGKE